MAGRIGAGMAAILALSNALQKSMVVPRIRWGAGFGTMSGLAVIASSRTGSNLDNVARDLGDSVNRMYGEIQPGNVVAPEMA